MSSLFRSSFFSRARRAGWLPSAAALVALVLGSLGVSPDLGAQDAAVAARVEEVLKLFQEGNYAQALALAEQLFAEAPNNNAIAAVLGRAQFGVIIQMATSDDPRIAGVGLQLLRLQRGGVTQRLSDSAQIRAKIDAYLAADNQGRLDLRLEIARTIGRNAVPLLIEDLAREDKKLRTDALLLVAEIGLDAVPVLVAAAEHSSPLVRTAVAQILGNRNLRHPFVASPLATLAQHDGEKNVRDAARDSLAGVLKHFGYGEDEAVEYLYKSAEQLYLAGHLNPFNNPYYPAAVFKLRDDKIVTEPVAEFQVSDRMAEQLLLKALRLKPTDQEARALLACVDALQLVEYGIALESEASDAELRAILDSQAGAMRAVRQPRLLATPAPVLAEALAMALEDRQNQVAVRILDTMQARGLRGQVPVALATSLSDSPARAVRVRAAIVLADWNTTDLSASLAKSVVDVLSEAVVNSGIRTAHTVLGNPENANRFIALFRDLNLESYANSRDVEVAIERAAQIPPDFILIDDAARVTVASAGVSSVNFFIKQIRNNSRTSGLPIVVAVNPTRFESVQGLYGKGDDKVKVVPSDIDRQGFKQSVLDPTFEGRDDDKSRALELAAMAARALERLAGSATALPIGGAVESLTEVLENRHDSVRIPCIGALGNLRAQAAASVGAVAQLFATPENSIEVRQAAMQAVARILEAQRGETPPAVVKIVLDGMAETDLRLREAAYMAFASVSLSPEQIVDALLKAEPVTIDAGAADADATTAEGAAEEAKEGATEETPAEEGAEAEEKPAEEEKTEEGSEADGGN